MATLALLVFAVIAVSLLSLSRKESSVTLFWMPFCPYGQEAAKILLTVGDPETQTVDLRFRFIAIEHSRTSPPASTAPVPSSVSSKSGCEQKPVTNPDFGRFSTLHGRRETEESMRQVAILKRWPKTFVDYLKAFLDNPNTAWQSHAEKAGIPVAELDDLVQSPNGAKWFSENILEAREMGITLSPTLVVNGKPLSRFPVSEEELRMVLCSAGVLKDNCQGVLCDTVLPCPEKHGYVGKCERGQCVYQLAPQRHDAVSAWLITPEDCVPAKEFPADDVIKGWTSYLNVTRVPLSDPKAQEMLAGTKLSSFPVLVVDNSLSNREWGEQCIHELNLVRYGNRFLVAFDYAHSPFVTYAEVVRTPAGLSVKPDHYAGALMLHQMGRLEAATKSYRLALAENSEDYRAWNNLGAILYDMHGLKRSGGAMFQRASALNASYEPALHNLLRYATDQKDAQGIAAAQERLGWLAIENKRWEEAAAVLLEVSKTKEWEFSARKGLAYIAVQESRPMDALKELERCLQLNSEPDGDFSNLLGGVYFRLGDHASAVAWYERAVNTANPSGQAYPNLCYLLQAAEQWGKLLSISDKALSLYPQDSVFGFYKAEALARLGQKSEAISLLKELSQTSEEAEFRSSYELAKLYRDQKDKLAATMYARQFVQKVAIQRQPAVKEECMNIGKLALEFDETALASEAFQQVLRIKPSDVAAHDLLAACYKQLGQEERSQDHQTLARQFGGAVE